MQIMKIAASWSAAQAVAEAALQAAWQAHSAGSYTSVEQLEAAHDRAAKAAEDLVLALLPLKPQTATEAATKFGILLHQYGDGAGGIDSPAPIIAFLDDLEDLARNQLPARPQQRAA